MDTRLPVSSTRVVPTPVAIRHTHAVHSTTAGSPAAHCQLVARGESLRQLLYHGQSRGEDAHSEAVVAVAVAASLVDVTVVAVAVAASLLDVTVVVVVTAVGVVAEAEVEAEAVSTDVLGGWDEDGVVLQVAVVVVGALGRGGRACATFLCLNRWGHEHGRLGVLVIRAAVERHGEVLLDDGGQAVGVEGLEDEGVGACGHEFLAVVVARHSDDDAGVAPATHLSVGVTVVGERVGSEGVIG